MGRGDQRGGVERCEGMYRECNYYEGQSSVKFRLAENVLHFVRTVYMHTAHCHSYQNRALDPLQSLYC